MIACTIANTNRAKGKPAAKLKNFLFQWDREAQTWQQQLLIATALQSQLGGTITTRAERE